MNRAVVFTLKLKNFDFFTSKTLNSDQFGQKFAEIALKLL